jgi:hypothetical protein
VGLLIQSKISFQRMPSLVVLLLLSLVVVVVVVVVVP